MVCSTASAPAVVTVVSRAGSEIASGVSAAASAMALMTESMVPSTGWRTAR